MSGQVIFSITNHHVEVAGVPPHIDDSQGNQLHYYFENRHGDQFIFVYDLDTNAGVLYCGDAGWEHPDSVMNGEPQRIALNTIEQAWLKDCWNTATGTKAQ